MYHYAATPVDSNAGLREEMWAVHEGTFATLSDGLLAADVQERLTAEEVEEMLQPLLAKTASTWSSTVWRYVTFFRCA